MGQTTRASRSHLLPIFLPSTTTAARIPLCQSMEAFPLSRAAEVAGTDVDDDHKRALQAAGRGGRQRKPGDRRRRLKLTFLEEATLISDLLARGAHTAQGKI
jgi:hypothetical protein